MLSLFVSNTHTCSGTAMCYSVLLLLVGRNKKKNFLAWVRERTIPAVRLLVVGEVSTNFADRRCHVVSLTDPYGRILCFLDRSRYFFFQVALQLYPRGWVNPVPDPLLLRKSDSGGNRIRTSGYVARNSDHLTTKAVGKKYAPSFLFCRDYISLTVRMCVCMCRHTLCRLRTT
jgi:hypothetical protein